MCVLALVAHTTTSWLLPQVSPNEPTHGHNPGLARFAVKPSNHVRSHAPRSCVATNERRSVEGWVPVPLTQCIPCWVRCAHRFCCMRRSLYANQLTGAIPDSLGSLLNLQYMCARCAGSRAARERGAACCSRDAPATCALCLHPVLTWRACCYARHAGTRAGPSTLTSSRARSQTRSARFYIFRKCALCRHASCASVVTRGSEGAGQRTSSCP
jgi:hypothetical protein